MSVRPVGAAPNGRILVKSGTGDFLFTKFC